jgi:sugar lactone lactonase YvrE
LCVQRQKVGWLWAARVVDLYWPFAYNGMVADAAGNVYGATAHGGVDGEGAIYQFTPNQKSLDDTKVPRAARSGI